jgi:hypothetical protein
MRDAGIADAGVSFLDADAQLCILACNKQKTCLEK